LAEVNKVKAFHNLERYEEAIECYNAPIEMKESECTYFYMALSNVHFRFMLEHYEILKISHQFTFTQTGL